MQDIVNQLQKVLDELYVGKIPGEEYTLDELKCFCRSIIDGQRKNIPGLKPGSWCLAPAGSERMPWDARVDFIMFPTYLAISILTLTMKRFPDIMESLDGFMDALKSGYLFATGMNLNGHGHEADDDRKRAVEILKKGGVFEFVKKNPEFSPEMFEIAQNL